MCGISGIFKFNNDTLSLRELKYFTDNMVHRGPDGEGYEILDDGYLGLGQRRLSILDLSDIGKQPMSYEEGRFWITYNGEVFNFFEIRQELKSLGYGFKSNTDTEVILASYVQWGKACLNKFNGMWAFAIWDSQKKTLFLARDRFGIKPLYYVHRPNQFFVFASETRAFKFLEGFKREIDEELLQINLHDSYALEGLGYTPFKEIVQLLPGHCMTITRDKSTVQQKRWWHIEDHLHEEVPNTMEAQAEKFYEIFRDACRIRLVSDVPVATALSGGLDSSSVYSVVYDILQKETLGRVNKDSQRAFSAIFPGLPQNEKEYADLAANFVGAKLNYIETDFNNLENQIQYDTELCDFISPSPITSISAVYKGMKENGITVSMDGHGVDEMLYGYRDMAYSLYNHSLWQGTIEQSRDYAEVLANMYHPQDQANQILKFNKAIAEKEQREKSKLNKIKRFVKPRSKNMDFFPVNLLSLSDRPYDFSKHTLPQRMVYFEFFQHTLPALLRNFDRASMMNSIEIRMPFMDWRLVTYVFSLPVSSKIGQGFTKLLLREAMKGKMDETVRTRTYKVGIGSPIDYWFSSVLKDWILDTVKDVKLREKLLYEYKSGKVSASIVRETWLGINLELIK
jgi:asparagine synthase (glutamine-hydrolysing)